MSKRKKTPELTFAFTATPSQATLDLFGQEAHWPAPQEGVGAGHD